MHTPKSAKTPRISQRVMLGRSLCLVILVGVFLEKAPYPSDSSFTSQARPSPTTTITYNQDTCFDYFQLHYRLCAIICTPSTQQLPTTTTTTHNHSTFSGYFQLSTLRSIRYNFHSSECRLHALVWIIGSWLPNKQGLVHMETVSTLI